MNKNFSEIIIYNKNSASKFGWSPDWFEAKFFDTLLIFSIKKWQKEYGLKPDGLVGPLTFRRKFTERESNISFFRKKSDSKKNTSIVWNGHLIDIKWPVVLWDEKDGLKCRKGSYIEQINGKRDISFFVNHWDACLSSKSCSKIMEKRNLSVHWCIDNDGTIYQLLDANHIAFHAGKKKWNKKSVGVEISNAYYLKYNNWYEKNGFGKRPIMKNVEVHGVKLEDHLGFYKIQLLALKALIKGMVELGIELKAPLNSEGELIEKVSDECAAGSFKGVINHYNLTRRKIDCAGLDLKSLVK